ncbi:UDP-glucose 4-epimerase [Vanrija pseudolonga]|uniref:UDP-glucose 4-epimerase n=1 Tax=Vanrija pseudolonga TaxID=143232 RepID=A0AAF0YLJ0_9TREE|nr:UDP-glucose 4-epimerase [Vanrija pseudolonga]
MTASTTSDSHLLTPVDSVTVNPFLYRVDDDVTFLELDAYLWCKANDRKVPSLRFENLDYRSQDLAALLDEYAISGSSALRSRISGVIHFAAFKSVSESISQPIDYYRNNVCGLVDLVALLNTYGIHKFVFSSSATVYGTKADLGQPLSEYDVVHHPESFLDRQGDVSHATPGVTGLTSPYGRTKYFGKAILADVAYSAPSKWSIVALPYFNPIGCDASGLLGEDPRGVPTNLFPVITNVLTGRRDHLDVCGSDWDTRDGTAIRDFIHVSDLARGHIAALDTNISAPFRTFNLGTGNGTTVAEAIHALEQASGRKVPSPLAPRRPGDVGSCVA